MHTYSTPKIVGPRDGKADSLGSIGVRFMIDTEETHDGGFSLVEHPMPPRALAARYGLEMDFDSIPGLCERFGLTFGEPPTA